MTDASLTVSEFCAAEKLSRSMLYKLWAEGNGPRTFNVGTKRLISYESRQEWRHAREAESTQASRVAETVSA